MSAAEKLGALDKAAVRAPWLAEDDGKTLIPTVEVLAGNREDRAVIATLRNALPQIVAVVQAAERVPRLRYSNAQPSLSLSWDAKALHAALAALDEKLGDVT